MISDIGLPDGSGYELMQVLQALSPIKGIALSGYGMKADVDQSEAAGFSAHLTKPCDLSVLNSTIGKAFIIVCISYDCSSGRGRDYGILAGGIVDPIG